MNEKQQFLKLLKAAKRKLYVKHASNYTHLGLLIVSTVLLVISLLARIFVITHLSEKLMLAVLLILLSICILAVIKRPTRIDAAIYFDQFVTEDRVKTTLHYLDEETIMSQLQRRDAIVHMKSAAPKLMSDKIKFIYWKHLAAFILLSSVVVAFLYFPNDVMKMAQEQEKEEEIVEEAKDEIEKIVKEDKEEQLNDLQEQTKEETDSQDLLEKLLAEEANLEKELQKASQDEKQLKELSKELQDFQDIAEALEQADSDKLTTAMDALMEKELSSLTEQQQQALEDLLSQVMNQEGLSVSELSEEQINELLASLESQLNSMMQNANSLSDLSALQQQLQAIASTLNENMVNNGLSNSNQLAFGPSSNSNPNTQNSSQSSAGENGNSNGQGQNSSQGSGNGTSPGNGNGSGSGSGSGNGSGLGSGNGSGGSGSGSGTGSGAGFGQGSRELTIPETLEGEESTENDFGELGEGSGEQQIAPDGLVLKGSIRSYDEVYGNYAESYRNSVDRMELPTYLEDVVKDYFSDLNPEGE